MFDVVCIGNALIDSFLTIHEANNYCRVNHETGELCIKSGEKIPLENAQFEPGGNANNVSVGISRLGLRTAVVLELGKDAFAHRIKKQLEDEGVNLSHIVTSDTSSSFGIGINFRGERSLFVWHVERKHEFDINPVKTKWMYLSSMGETWRHVYRSVPPFIRDSGCRLAFNPGTRQIQAGKDILEPVLAVTDILFVNKEEAQRISNIKYSHSAKASRDKQLSNLTDKKEQIQKLLTKLQKMGPKIVVITDGNRGAYAIDYEGKLYHQGIIHTDVVEKTGAGDSFSSGFLAATVYGLDIRTALLWGAVNSASVIGKIGAQPGLLTREKMEKSIKTIKQ